jgi:ketosteroid isomerase-like protein
MALRPPPPAATFGGSPDEVEAQFYEALQRGDIERLMAVWADDDEIVCVHPGGPRVIGAGAIRAAFEAIFANGGIPVHPEQVHRLTLLGSALHHLVERIDMATDKGVQSAWVLASNFYVKTGLGWRLAAHHASPGMAEGPSEPRGSAPSTLH